MNIKDAIKKIISLKDLTEKETYSVFSAIMSGKATPVQIGALITALRIKGEAVDEITGAARVMREKAVKVKVSGKSTGILDTCGTGGTGTKAFNVSTTVAFVAAACGVKVAKHGNRAVSSKCGSADVLEELGVKLDIPVRVVQKCINTINVGFIFAPNFHKAMRYAAVPRKELGIRTIFNILGPLCNPASAACQVIGVYDESLTETIARVLKKLGSHRAYVVSGAGPLDEVTPTGKTKVSELKGGRVRSYYVNPGTFGMKKAGLSAIKGGTAARNAAIIRGILSGKKGPKRDTVLMNSSMALMAAGKAKNFSEGVRLAEAAIDSGEALAKLEELIRITNGERV